MTGNTMGPSPGATVDEGTQARAYTSERSG